MCSPYDAFCASRQGNLAPWQWDRSSSPGPVACGRQSLLWRMNRAPARWAARQGIISAIENHIRSVRPTATHPVSGSRRAKKPEYPAPGSSNDIPIDEGIPASAPKRRPGRNSRRSHRPRSLVQPRPRGEERARKERPRSPTDSNGMAYASWQRDRSHWSEETLEISA